MVVINDTPHDTSSLNHQETKPAHETTKRAPSLDNSCAADIPAWPEDQNPFELPTTKTIHLHDLLCNKQNVGF